MIPIHADLHVWNINKDKDNFYILDFDDCGLALPVWDMAVTLY
jgi:Ser/Thr protein kinase RdoA (MazF antagonist)